MFVTSPMVNVSTYSSNFSINFSKVILIYSLNIGSICFIYSFLNPNDPYHDVPIVNNLSCNKSISVECFPKSKYNLDESIKRI